MAGPERPAPPPSRRPDPPSKCTMGERRPRPVRAPDPLLSGRRLTALTAQQVAEQKKKAEEILGPDPSALGFAKALFFGHFHAPFVFPYPVLPPDRQAAASEAVAKVRQFCAERIDPAAIDRQA